MPKEVAYIAAAVIAVGILPLPYGYYTFVRLVACGAFVWVALDSFQANRTAMGAICASLALLFNPIIPVHLTREIWFPIDLGAAAFLTYLGWKSRTENLDHETN